MSRHKTGYVISYHGILCHDMLHVTTIVASLFWLHPYKMQGYTEVVYHQGDSNVIKCSIYQSLHPLCATLKSYKCVAT